MNIRTDGQDYHVTSQAQGNFNSVGAAAGIASLLGVNFSNLLGARYNPNMSPDALIAALSASKNGSNDAVISALISAIVSLIPTVMGNNNNCNCSENTYVNRFELSQEQNIAAKDAEIALLKAKDEIKQQMIDLTKYVDGKIEGVKSDFSAYKEAQAAEKIQQAALTATQTATINCMKQQIDALNGEFNGLTKNYVPSYNVCQQPTCGCVTNYGCGAQVIG